MKKITINEIGNCISEALKDKKKNILFVDIALTYKKVLEWAENHPGYNVIRLAEPQPLYEEKDGRLVKSKEHFVIDDQKLKKLNFDKSILLSISFSEACIYNFEGYLDILKWRYYVNVFPDGERIKHNVNRMALFIAFSAPCNTTDPASLDPKYYELFDEVYVLE